MPLTGTLRDLSLANLVQLQCSELNQAQVTLAYQASRGKLIFSNGELVYARTGDKVGDVAVYDLLTWEDGDFEVTSDQITVERNVETPWGSLLLEGLRLADEQRAEMDAALEASLRNLKGKQGLRDALVVSGSGQVRANAKDHHTQEDAALVAFIAGRAESISSILNMGTLVEALAVNPNEKVMIRRLGFNFLGSWLDGRTAPETIRALLKSLDAKS